MANESEYSTNISVYVTCKIKTFQSLPLPVVDLLERANTASLLHSFNQLLEKLGVAIQKHVDIQVFDNV